jgi:hypothetical protein
MNMKNSPFKIAGPAALELLLVFQFSFGLLHSARADISEPDNILYGNIVIGTNYVTATRTDVVIEARRTTNGPAIASYRMGTSPGLGDLYALRIPVEARVPLTNTNASLAGDTLYIVLSDAAGVEGQTSYTIPERGAVQLVNFGLPAIDTNGLPYAWEIYWFGRTGIDPNADPDGDGRSNFQEWIAGTNPLDPHDVFDVSIQQAAGQISVTFVALRAAGAGYDGLVRRYSLQTTTNLVPALWADVPGYTSLIGSNQVVTLQFPATNVVPPVYFRGSVWLESGQYQFTDPIRPITRNASTR